jgi:toxin ParE1/3/4
VSDTRLPVVWSSTALLDLSAIFEYHRRRDPAAARALVRRLHDAAERVAAHPDSGPLATDLEPPDRYRHMVVRPYRLIYRVDTNRVLMLRVWDARRNPDDLVTGE